MPDSDLITKVDLPRSSLATFLCEMATYSDKILSHHRDGHLPYVFVSPPPPCGNHEEGGLGGWVMVEWVFSVSGSKTKFQAFQSFNPKVGRIYTVINERFKPSEAGYRNVGGEKIFFQNLQHDIKGSSEEAFKIEWYDRSQARMGSRVHLDEGDLFNSFFPRDHKITHEVEKKMCFLALSVFETFVHADEKDYPEMIKAFDKTLSVCYLPVSPDVTYHAVLS